MKATFDLPEDLFKALKLRAVNEGRKLKDTVTDLLRAGLAAQRNGPRRGGENGRTTINRDRKTGLPVIHCPSNAPARRMTAAQLHALEQESQTGEDLERAGISIR
jgi:plasmid stability protein